MTTITDQITNATNATAQAKAAEPKATGAASSNLTSNDFLSLMMKQLQFQDPMAPTDNAQFISQECQFSQLSTTQDISKSITENNAIMQTLSLVGKDVVLTDPSDAKKTISGTVSSADFTSTGASILVNGKEYPISQVKTVKEHSATNTTDTTNKTNTNSGSGSGTT